MLLLRITGMQLLVGYSKPVVTFALDMCTMAKLNLYLASYRIGILDSLTNMFFAASTRIEVDNCIQVNVLFVTNRSVKDVLASTVERIVDETILVFEKGTTTFLAM